jgi:predicted PurR-regulated permease PerM
MNLLGGIVFGFLVFFLALILTAYIMEWIERRQIKWIMKKYQIRQMKK